MVRVPTSVFSFADHFQVGEGVVRLIPISVMDVVANGNRAMSAFPYMSMEVTSFPLRRSVVAIGAAAVLPALIDDEGQRSWSFTQHKPTPLEHHINRLPRDSECGADLGKAVALLVERVHRFRQFILTWGCHAQRLTHARGVADGLAAGMDLPRAARLRLTGNGVVPAQAERAFRTLWGQLT